MLHSFFRNIVSFGMTEYYKLIPIKLGCMVLGIDLKTENRPEVCCMLLCKVKDVKSLTAAIRNYPGSCHVYGSAPVYSNFIKQIKEDVTKHRLLIFKNQGIISGARHVEISKWFGELESTFYKHPKSPHPDVFRVSNDKNEGCTGVGRTGWHIDGSFQPAPFAYSLYHMVSVPKKGATVFAPLTEIIEQLQRKKYDEWNRLWMVSDRRSGPVHPLIYKHPRSGKEVLCFHLGMTTGFIYDYNTPKERVASEDEFYRILEDIHHEFVKDDGKIQYKHEWEDGDFIISDNLAVGHEASPDSQISSSDVGLRVLHRTTIQGVEPPTK